MAAHLEPRILLVDEVITIDTALLRLLKRDMDDGESEVIALAIEQQASLVLLDESDARKTAGLYGLPKTEVIGLLIRARQQGHIRSLKTEVDKFVDLVRSYFRMDGHHIQFNVIDAETLRAAQAEPEKYRDLIVRVAGYSDYFCDLGKTLQDEIISRTEHDAF